MSARRIQAERGRGRRTDGGTGCAQRWRRQAHEQAEATAPTWATARVRGVSRHANPLSVSACTEHTGHPSLGPRAKTYKRAHVFV